LSKRRKSKHQKSETKKSQPLKSETQPTRRKLPLLIVVAATAVVLVLIGSRVMGGNSNRGPVAFTILHTNDTAGYVDPCG